MVTSPSETFGRKDLRRKCWTAARCSGGRTATRLAGRGAGEWARGLGFGPGLDVRYPSTPAPRAQADNNESDKKEKKKGGFFKKFFK